MLLPVRHGLADFAGHFLFLDRFAFVVAVSAVADGVVLGESSGAMAGEQRAVGINIFLMIDSSNSSAHSYCCSV